MTAIGIPIVVVQSKAIRAGKHQNGDFIVRLLISGIGCILVGLIIILKNL